MAQDNINMENDNMDKPKPKARRRPKAQHDDRQPETKKANKKESKQDIKKQKRQ